MSFSGHNKTEKNCPVTISEKAQKQEGYRKKILSSFEEKMR